MTGEDGGPVFIVGMNGSGTTLMLDHLGNHPRLFGFRHETHVLPDYLIRSDRYGDLERDGNYLRLWDDMRSEYAFRRANKGEPVSLPEDWAESPRSAAQAFDRIMRSFARSEGKTRWCEKTPFYALHIHTIATVFPNAKFIHMIRDGRDCARSNARRWGRHPLGEIYRWKQFVSEARRQGSALEGRYEEIRYEDLVSNPDSNMKRVCSFLGVAFDASVLTANRPRGHMAGIKSSTIVRKPTEGEHRLPHRTLARFEEIAGDQLGELGYRCKHESVRKDPILPERAWWFVHDAVSVLSRRISRKVVSQKNMTWSLFFARLSATFRQMLHSSPRRGPTDRR